MPPIFRLSCTTFAGAALAWASPVAAQDDTYMGIDLNAPAVQPEGRPEQRRVGLDLKALLDEGVALGCLAFTPPASYAQTGDASEACREYIGRLTKASAPESAAQDDETAAPAAASPLADLPLVSVARMAYNDDKRAQFELAMRFEEGRGGVDVDWEKARELYRQAGRNSPERKGFTRLPDGEGGTKLGVGVASPRVPGIREARERLKLLERKMEKARDYTNAPALTD